MEIKGVIVSVLNVISGEGKNGIWMKQDYILEVPGQYPKKVCFTLWNDKIDLYNLSDGDLVTVHIEIESREHNSRWYTSITAWKVDKQSFSGNNTSQQRQQPASTQAEIEYDEDDDLPF